MDTSTIDCQLQRTDGEIMEKVFGWMVAALTLVCFGANAETLQAYVQQCQNELHFNASDVPALDCHNGTLFAGGGVGPVNDFVGHQRINDAVDLVFACRWLNNTDPDAKYRDKTAASIELLIHNRQNGSTCFFNAKDSYPVPIPDGDIEVARRAVATAIVSPTNFGSAHPNANDYWLQPADLDTKRVPAIPIGADTPDSKDSIRCVGCHVAGPYIASRDIALKLRN